MTPTFRRPRIGITSDIVERRFQAGQAYADCVWKAGGLPVILPCIPEAAAELVADCDGIVLTGGDDPLTETWGLPTHPKATPVHPDRQAFELSVLKQLDQHPRRPALGICLGMQYMGLQAGGRLNQHLPDTLATAQEHANRREHRVVGNLGDGVVSSHHHQALDDPGRLSILAKSPDGVIEAIGDPQRTFYLGVQWHPERTADHVMGQALFERLVEAARGAGRTDAARLK